MTLSEFREPFVETTGRYDLVKDTENYKDDGANRLVNMGVRKLDSMFTHSKSMGHVPFKLKPTQALYEMDNLLSIEGVVITVDGGGVVLDHILEQDLEVLDIEEGDTGAPKFYCISSTMRGNGLGNPVTGYGKVAFKIAPPPDQAYSAKVYGRITEPLENDEDSNFWTVAHPETLISATMYMIERFHRNRQGMADHMTAIQDDLRNLDFNAIESQMGSNTQMNDSFNYRAEGNEW